MALRQRASAEVFRGTFGAKAAETRESVAQKRERTWRARDGTVGVAQYVIASPWAHWASESSAIKGKGEIKERCRRHSCFYCCILPLQRTSIVELFRPACDVIAYDLMFGVGLGREFRPRNGKIDRPRYPLSAKCGSSAPRSHRHKTVLSTAALTTTLSRRRPRRATMNTLERGSRPPSDAA